MAFLISKFNTIKSNRFLLNKNINLTSRIFAQCLNKLIYVSHLWDEIFLLCRLSAMISNADLRLRVSYFKFNLIYLCYILDLNGRWPPRPGDHQALVTIPKDEHQRMVTTMPLETTRVWCYICVVWLYSFHCRWQL